MGYLAPDIGIDAVRDAVAAIKCVAAGDSEGLDAVVNGNEHPRCLVAAIAVIAAKICHQGGLDDAGIAALLAWIAPQGADFFLDQEKPAEGGD